ncbi:MAG: hypothetical protein SFV81_12915 [Pirellulaceae bacterium]|nr:hypothetical protein [Pirellulaceae bacterium]
MHGFKFTNTMILWTALPLNLDVGQIHRVPISTDSAAAIEPQPAGEVSRRR